MSVKIIIDTNIFLGFYSIQTNIFKKVTSNSLRHLVMFNCLVLFFHNLYKPEKVIIIRQGLVIFASIAMYMRIRVMFIVELYDMKSTLIHIEVDISLFEIRCDGFPKHSIRILCFNGFPSRKTNSLAVIFWRYIE